MLGLQRLVLVRKMSLWFSEERRPRWLRPHQSGLQRLVLKLPPCLSGERRPRSLRPQQSGLPSLLLHSHPRRWPRPCLRCPPPAATLRRWGKGGLATAQPRAQSRRPRPCSGRRPVNRCGTGGPAMPQRLARSLELPQRQCPGRSLELAALALVRRSSTRLAPVASAAAPRPLQPFRRKYHWFQEAPQPPAPA